MPSQRTSRVDTVKQRLLERLRHGYYRAGDRFLSNRDVAEQFAISYQTAHRLIAELCHEGHLARRAQSGTYVPGTPAQLVGVQVLFHSRAGKAWSFGAKLLEMLRARLTAEHLDTQVELCERSATLDETRLPIIWELPEVVAQCARRGMPAVMINDRPPSGLSSLFIDSVSTDDFSGGACAAQLFIDKCQSRTGLAMVVGPADDARSRQRQAGFESIVKARVVRAGNWYFDDGFRVAAEAVARARHGLFCVNDQLAAGVIHWCHQQRIAPPPIIGFDDAPVAATLNLTTIAIPWQELVDGVVSIARRRLSGDRSASMQQVFSPRPVIRGPVNRR